MARMRGFGTCTKAMVKKVADSWTNGDVEIVEFLTHYELNKKYTHEQMKQFTHAKLSLNDYEFKIVFNNEIGIPPNMQDVYNAIEEIKPAHLNVRYEFKFRRHQELVNKTHEQLSGFTHNIIRQGVI